MYNMEVLNDLVGYKNLKIYQNSDWFTFSLDSVLLANFVTINPKTKKILDLGCGNAPIPLILSTKTKASIVGVEIQKDSYDLATKSVLYNHLENQIQLLLDKYHDDGKDPNAMAKSMSWLKTNMKLAVNESDGTVADLITDGCNMGVKSLSRYLNQYKAADETSKQITKRLIELEEHLAHSVRPFL